MTGALSGLRLVCPRCRAPLDAEQDGARCGACGAAFPRADGILDLRAGRVGAAGYDPHYFPTLAEVEREHYWFATRREVVRDVLRDAVPDLARARRSSTSAAAAAGCSRSWPRAGSGVAGACDVYPESLALVRRRVAAPLLLVDEGRFPPLGTGQTLLSLFDVLEHIDDDVGTLGHLVRACSSRAGSWCSPFRRTRSCSTRWTRSRTTGGATRARELGSKLRAAGFEVRHLAHFMAPLVPLVTLRWAARALPGRRQRHAAGARRSCGSRPSSTG